MYYLFDKTLKFSQNLKLKKEEEVISVEFALLCLALI